MRARFLALLLPGLFAFGASAADMAEALNVAGSQRMLSQRTAAPDASGAHEFSYRFVYRFVRLVD